MYIIDYIALKQMEEKIKLKIKPLLNGLIPRSPTLKRCHIKKIKKSIKLTIGRTFYFP